MARVEGELVIERPLEEVFDLVADERNEPHFNALRRAAKVSSGPIGVGTRFAGEMSTGRRRTPMTIEFTGFERPAAACLHDAVAFDGDPRGPCL